MTTNESTEPSVPREETTLDEVYRRLLEGTFYEDYDWASGPALRAVHLATQPATSREAVGDWRKALKLARPIVEADISTAEGYADADWEGMSRTALEAIDAALTPAPAAGVEIPEGYALVPIEPTSRMTEAAEDVKVEHPGYPSTWLIDTEAAEVWRVMLNAHLAASPAPADVRAAQVRGSGS